MKAYCAGRSTALPKAWPSGFVGMPPRAPSSSRPATATTASTCAASPSARCACTCRTCTRWCTARGTGDHGQPSHASWRSKMVRARSTASTSAPPRSALPTTSLGQWCPVRDAVDGDRGGAHRHEEPHGPDDRARCEGHGGRERHEPREHHGQHHGHARERVERARPCAARGSRVLDDGAERERDAEPGEAREREPGREHATPQREHDRHQDGSEGGPPPDGGAQPGEQLGAGTVVEPTGHAHVGAVEPRRRPRDEHGPTDRHGARDRRRDLERTARSATSGTCGARWPRALDRRHDLLVAHRATGIDEEVDGVDPDAVGIIVCIVGLVGLWFFSSVPRCRGAEPETRRSTKAAACRERRYHRRS